MNVDTTTREMAPARAERSSTDIDDQRRELRGRIDTLRQAGALPAAQQGDASVSVAQWTNWSNG